MGEEHSEDKGRGAGPFLVLIAILAFVVIIMLITPNLTKVITKDPRIPTYDDILPHGAATGGAVNIADPKFIPAVVKENNPLMVQVVENIESYMGCGDDHFCATQGFYSFMNMRIDLVVARTSNYIQHPSKTMLIREGRDADRAVLLAALYYNFDPSIKQRILYTEKDEYALEIWYRANRDEEEQWVMLNVDCEVCKYGGEGTPLQGERITYVDIVS